MIKLRQDTPTGGDCTAGYEVVFDKEYTVKEFIDYILTRNEWGCIRIKYSRKDCEYKRNELLGSLPQEYLDKKIKSARACGGWSNMDYSIETQG